ncbi:MAG: DUF1080 domain-containing protein [Bacteroidota bacterium]|nr:DUF1080 domain-containing protein [Bacteroidota bacterium]
MKIRNALLIILGLFFGLILLLDCSHGKKKVESVQDSIGQEISMVSERMNTLSELEIEEGWVLLFDGKTMNGWRNFQSEEIPKGWKVEDGNLIALGLGGDIGGDIVSEKEFENFHLKLEWKIEEGGNSGILYHVKEGDYSAVYVTGPEYQIIDDIGYPDTLEDWQTCGANYALHVPVNSKIKPAGEWNSSEIIVDGAMVTHFLNGSKVVEFEMWTEEWNTLVENSKWKDFPDYGKAHKGHLSLQDHGSLTSFRNIKIKEL